MDALIKTVWDICRLCAAPKDVPASGALFLSTHWLIAGLLAAGCFILSARVLAALLPAHAGVR